MSGDNPPEDIETIEEFEVALQELLAAATHNGVDPRGSCVCEMDDGHHDWEVMVYELE